MDPPEHGRWRRAYNKLFAPPIMAALEPRIQAIAEALVDGFLAEGVDIPGLMRGPVELMVEWTALPTG